MTRRPLTTNDKGDFPSKNESGSAGEKERIMASHSDCDGAQSVSGERGVQVEHVQLYNRPNFAQIRVDEDRGRCSRTRRTNWMCRPVGIFSGRASASFLLGRQKAGKKGETRTEPLASL